MLVTGGRQIWSPLTPMVAGATVMPIAERAFARGRARAVGRPKAPGPPRVGGSPWLPRLGCTALMVIDHHRESAGPLGWRALLEACDQGSAQRVGLARPEAGAPRPGS